MAELSMLYIDELHAIKLICSPQAVDDLPFTVHNGKIDTEKSELQI